MAIAKYKQIINVNDFRVECPDLAIHTDETITSAIYRSSEFLNMTCAGLISKVWDYNTQTTTDPNNDLYRTQEEIDYLKSAIVTQTAYYINNGNTNNVGSDGFSLDGFAFNHSTPVTRQVLAPNVELYLTEARVYTLWKSSGTNASNDKQANYEDWNKLLSQEHIWAASDSRYVHQWQEPAVDGNVAVIRSNGVVFENINNVLDNTPINKANKADLVKDSSNNTYTAIENNNKILSMDANIQGNVTDIATINTNIETLNRKQNQIINSLRASGLLVVVGPYVAGNTYQLGNVVSNGGLLYLSLVNDNTATLTDTTKWTLLNYSLNTDGFATTQQITDLQNQINTANSNKVTTNTDQTITAIKQFRNHTYIAQGPNQELGLGTLLRLGYGGNAGYITPDSTGNKDLYLKDSSHGAFIVKLNNEPNRIVEIGNPTQNDAVANKGYVDSTVQTLRNEVNGLNNIKFAGTWNSTTNYVVGDTVEWDNKLWLARNPNTNSEPALGNNNWFVYGQGTLEVNLANYYTKAQVDTKTNQLASDINTTNSNVRTLQSTVNQKADTNYVTNNYYNRNYINQNIYTKSQTDAKIQEVKNQINAKHKEWVSWSRFKSAGAGCYKGQAVMGNSTVYWYAKSLSVILAWQDSVINNLNAVLVWKDTIHYQPDPIIFMTDINHTTTTTYGTEANGEIDHHYAIIRVHSNQDPLAKLNQLLLGVWFFWN